MLKAADVVRLRKSVATINIVKSIVRNTLCNIEGSHVWWGGGAKSALKIGKCVGFFLRKKKVMMSHINHDLSGFVKV